MDNRILIVNADDLGLSEAINRGVLRAHLDGVVTSASLMVRRPASESACEHTRGLRGLSLGLHVDLGEPQADGLVDMPRDALAREVASQLEEFRRLTGRDPTHLDSHFHVHLQPPARDVLVALAAQLRVPLRFFDARIKHCGVFWGLTKDGEPRPTTIRVDALLAILETLPPGATELGCHPGDGKDLVDDYGAQLRALELETLCDPHVRGALQDRGVRLSSFAPYRRAKSS